MQLFCDEPLKIWDEGLIMAERKAPALRENDTNYLAGFEFRLLHQFPVHKCTGGRAEVFEPCARVGDCDLAMCGGNRWVFDREGVLSAPAQGDGAGLKFNGPLLGRIRVDHESRHPLVRRIISG